MARVEIKIPDWLDKICAWPVMVYRKCKYGYSFRRINLGEGEWTTVDTEDYYKFGKHRWYLKGSNGKFYAAREFKVDSERTTTLRLHREIMNAPAGLVVDHKNGISLENRRANLRLATHAQNMYNKAKTKSKTSSRFIGVCFVKAVNKWEAKIYYQGKKIWLGYFDNEIDAAKAYDAAARKYHGEFARLNFSE